MGVNPDTNGRFTRLPVILVADDNETLRRVIVLTLGEGRFEIVQAADGPNALRLAKERCPRLIFLDWTMPGMSGLEVCRRLREDDSLADCRIIMLTGRAGDDDRREGLAAGADDFVTKPFSPLDILDKVSETLGPTALA